MPHTVELMRQQKNAIFRAIEEAGFEVSEFRWEETVVEPGSVLSPKVTHIPTDSYFLFTAAMQRWDTGMSDVSEWAPGNASPNERITERSWDTRIEHVQEWLDNIRREYFDPDLWEQAAATLSGESNEAAFFAPEERAEISMQLREIAAMMGERQGLSPDDRKVLEVRFVAPLEDASGKLPRGAWKLLLLGALINEGVRLGMRAETLQQVVIFAGQVLGHLFGGGMPQLPVAN
jgi:hypothetical protein